MTQACRCTSQDGSVARLGLVVCARPDVCRWRRVRVSGRCCPGSRPDAWPVRGPGRRLPRPPFRLTNSTDDPAGSLPGVRIADKILAGVTCIRLDASIVTCHSEKEQASPTFKRTFGFHQLLAYCDNSGEPLAGMLSKGSAGSNTAADHLAVLDDAIGALPPRYRRAHRSAGARALTAGACPVPAISHPGARRNLRTPGPAAGVLVIRALRSRSSTRPSRPPPSSVRPQ